MPTPEGIVRDIISPLLKRLDNISRLPGNETGSSDIKDIVGKNKEQLQSLKQEFEHEKKIEKDVSEKFGVVLQLVDEILEVAKATAAAASKESPASNPKGSSDSRQLQKQLEMIEEKITGIIEKKSRQSTVPAVSTPAASLRRSETEQPQQQQQPLEAERRIQQSDAMSHLRLIVENLDTRLKHCLFCLTIFPVDAVIKKRLLIHWWIGENIVKSAVDGKKCFEELSLRGLVIPVKKKHCQTAHSCKAHPWIRKLLISVAQSNAFLEFDSEGTPSDDYSRTHRAFLRKGRTFAGRSNQKGKGNDAEEDEEDEEDKALTLYNLDAKYVEFESSWFYGKKELGALQLGRWQSSDRHHIEITGRYFLEDLGSCKNLRYLSLRGMSRVESLPDSIGNLGKLVVLDLRACHNLEKLTSKVSSLVNLEYLDVSECYLLDQLPKGLKHLTKLEVLKGFVIAHASSKDPCRLSELAPLDKLRKLSISVGHESNNNELEALNSFKAPVTSLTVTWGVVLSKKAAAPATAGATTAAPAAAAAAAAAPAAASRQGSILRTGSVSTPHDFQFLKRLEKLDMRGFPKEKFPEWMSPAKLKLSSLKKLYIRGGTLKTFGNNKGWEKIEVRRLRFLKHLSFDASTPRDWFPKIKFVEIHECPKMSSWSSSEANPEVIIYHAHGAASPTQAAPAPAQTQAEAEVAPAVISDIGALADAIAATPQTQSTESAPAVLTENGAQADATAAAPPTQAEVEVEAAPAVQSEIREEED